MSVVHDGIGIPREYSNHNISSDKAALDRTPQGFLDPFQAANKINDVEISWTLGKMLLYASSQVPPARKASSAARPLLVGFGSNDPSGRPTDFQPAGGIAATLPDDLKETADDNDIDWHGGLFKSESPRRIPGIFLVILILALILFLLSGRDRRSSVLRKLRSLGGGSGKSRRPGLTAKYFSATSNHNQAAERLLESGAIDEFELSGDEMASYYSDSNLVSPSDSTAGTRRLGMTSGWATPQLKVGPPSVVYSDDQGVAATRGGTSAMSQNGGGLGLGLSLASPTRFGRPGPVLRGNSASPAKFR